MSPANKASGGRGGRAKQVGEQLGQLQGVFGANAFSVIAPDFYQATTGGAAFTRQATNFGKNVGGTWQFCSHTWMPALARAASCSTAASCPP
ncbi:hypothetical protein [Plastoroseomonas arctica]|uniref:Uncharacterized protein n=1 Tax=Plastoroseomonas arctica TaxID=1509237 RepID=A0AAF1KHU9_9PROT|nr:hypothetical protein [Plastoroseomonas arctica]MBR0653850.1 hypothetical protein [Plastoroseomonas arctica]